jgi:hypothetical protein
VISTAVQPKAVMFRALDLGRPDAGCAGISMAPIHMRDLSILGAKLLRNVAILALAKSRQTLPHFSQRPLPDLARL